MKKMKKLFVGVLLSCMLFTAVGCGNNDQNNIVTKRIFDKDNIPKVLLTDFH